MNSFGIKTCSKNWLHCLYLNSILNWSVIHSVEDLPEVVLAEIKRDMKQKEYNKQCMVKFLLLNL